MTPVTHCGGHAFGTRGSMVPWMSQNIQLLSLVIDNEGLHSCPRFRHAQIQRSALTFQEDLTIVGCLSIHLIAFPCLAGSIDVHLTGVVSTSQCYLA
jgi:hypothetical protein